jgi:hypothetical protein
MLTDTELCTAISTLREPKPEEFPAFGDLSSKGNWTLRWVGGNDYEWIAINWRLPEHAMRLFDELLLNYLECSITATNVDGKKEYTVECDYPIRLLNEYPQKQEILIVDGQPTAESAICLAYYEVMK